MDDDEEFWKRQSIFSKPVPGSTPSIAELQRLMRILAALDLVMSPEQEYRYHRYYGDWREGLDVARVYNGAGDHLWCLFTPQGALLKGFDHLSPLSPYGREDGAVWPGIYDSVPKTLLRLLRDNREFEMEDVTFCMWRLADESEWRKGKALGAEREDDGSDFLLGTLFRDAEHWWNWAIHYYGDSEQEEPDYDAAELVYRATRLDVETARLLNPACPFDQVRHELQILGISTA